MLSNLKNSIKHTGIYGLGNLATKLIGFVLLPLYTKYFEVSEFGILSILEITILILTQVFLLGQANAFLRFQSLEEYKHRKKSILFTIFIFLFFIALLLTLTGFVFAGQIASFSSQPENFKIYLKLVFLIVFLRILNNLFLSVLRANEKSLLYSIVNIIKIFINLSLSIYFVAFAQTGIVGILYAYITGEVILSLMVLPHIISEMVLEFDKEILASSLTFGAPLIFASLAGMLLNMGDRYILKILVNYHEVGLYDVGYRIASIINVLLVQSFSLSFLPQAYTLYKQKGDKRFYSKMLTYFVFVLCWTGLALSFFGREVIEIFALNRDYWPAYKIIPVIVFAHVFGGARAVTNIGSFLKKRTQDIAIAVVIAAILNIGLNFIFIPYYGMMGAAYATLISFFVLYLLSNYYSNRFYPIPYENRKVAKMILVAVCLYVVSTFLYDLHIVVKIFLKTGLLLVFPVILYFWKFYEEIELQKIRQGGDILLKRIKRIKS